MIRKLMICLCGLMLLSGCAAVSSENEIWIEYEMVIHQNQKGFLTVPKTKKSDAVVVLLSGSGFNDADYTVDGVGLYQQLAHDLAACGIASYRMDKRNTVTGQADSTIQEEILDDAQKAIHLLQKKYSKVFVLGHSLSAIVLPVLEADGMIFLAGSVTDLSQIYAKQLIKNADENEKLMILEELEIIQNLKSDTGFSWFGIKESWWLSFNQLPIQECLSTLEVPVLVMHGTKDDVIDSEEFEKYQSVFSHHPNVEFVMMEGLDHFFRSEGDLHIDETVILQIASWILKNT